MNGENAKVNIKLKLKSPYEMGLLLRVVADGCIWKYLYGVFKKLLSIAFIEQLI